MTEKQKKNLVTDDKKFWDKRSFKSIILISVPAILASILNSFIPFVDNFVAGSISNSAESAVAYSLNIQFTLMILLFGAMGAIGVVMAQYKGKDERDKVIDSHKFKLAFCLVLSILFAIVVFILPTQILSIFTKQQDIINNGKNFLRIYGLVFILAGINLAYTTSLTSLGHTRVALIATTSSIILNTTFDILFGLTLGWGTTGLAWATVIVEGVQILIFIIYCQIAKIKDLQFNPIKMLLIQKIVILKSLKRWHMVAVEVFFSLLTLLINVLMARSYDLPSQSSGTIIGIINPFVRIIFSAIGGFYSAIAVFCGQNLGRKKFDLAYMNYKRIMVTSISLALIFGAIISAFAPLIVKIYTEITPKPRLEAKMILHLYVLIAPIYTIGILSYRVLESGGQSLIVMVFDTVFMLFMVLITYLTFSLWHPADFWIAYIVAMSGRSIRALCAEFLVHEKLWLVDLTHEEAKEPHGTSLAFMNVITFGLYSLFNKLGKHLKAKKAEKIN